ncbi:MAG: hypothetical protein ABI275_01260 [Terrimesophilobacter sp.]
MTIRGAKQPPPRRADLEKLLSADIRAVTAPSDRTGRYFARQNGVSSSDGHALLHIMVADTAGRPLTMSELRHRKDLIAARRVLMAMIDAMDTFEAQLTQSGADRPMSNGPRAEGDDQP